MNGFSNDVKSILKTNGLLQKEGAGLVLTDTSRDAMDLYDELLKDGYVVANKRTKSVFNYDYVVMPIGWNWETLLYSLSVLSVGGAIIIQANQYMQERYVSRFGEFTGTKVRYGDNYYIVIKNGLDYGN